MNAPLVERRMPSHLDGARESSKSDVVRQSLLVRRQIGTLGALEFLKSHAVHSTVIQRVLAEGAVRAEDQEAMQTMQAMTAG